MGYLYVFTFFRYLPAFVHTTNGISLGAAILAQLAVVSSIYHVYLCSNRPHLCSASCMRSGLITVRLLTQKKNIITACPVVQLAYPVLIISGSDSCFTVLRNKKLSYRRGTARCVVSIEILPIATHRCRNYLYDKS